MKRLIIAAFTITAVSLPQATAADSRTMLSGADFLSACSRPDPEWIGFCHGYVQAVVDGVRRPGERLCVPAGTTRAKIVGDVVLYLTAETELQRFNAASVVSAVLLEAFPCP